VADGALVEGPGVVAVETDGLVAVVDGFVEKFVADVGAGSATKGVGVFRLELDGLGIGIDGLISLAGLEESLPAV
jgi:hypothetical protein